MIHGLSSSPAARMEVDSVHVVKRIVALLVDSFQPSHLPPAQQVRSKNNRPRDAFPLDSRFREYMYLEELFRLAMD